MSVQVDIVEEIIQVNLVEDEVVSVETGKGVTISNDGTKVATTRWIDFEPGNNVTISAVTQGDRVRVTISSTGGGGGSGTVTSFSASNLSPLFTSSVANPTTTPALTFAQVNQNANIVLAGPTTGSAAAPTFRSLVAADIPTLAYIPLAGSVFLTGAVEINSGGEEFKFIADQSAFILEAGTGETVTFDDDTGGLKYGADYSADFVDRSLVDKAYVDSVAGGGGSHALLGKINVSAAVTGTTAETIAGSFLVSASSVEANDVLRFYIMANKSASVGNTNIKVYVNDTNNLTTPTLIATLTNTAGNIYSSFTRRIFMKNSVSSFDIVDDATALTPDDAFQSTQAIDNISFDLSADFYFIVAFTPSNASDTMTLHGVTLERMR